MIGKNAGKFRPKQPWPGLQAELLPSDHRVRVAGRVPISRPKGVPDGSPNVEGRTWALITPRKIASELALFGFGGSMQPYVLDLVYQGVSGSPPPLM